MNEVSRSSARRHERTRTPGQGPAHQCHEFLSRPRSLQVPGGNNHTGTGRGTIRSISRYASGSPAAAPARRPTPSPCFSTKASRRRNRNIKLQVFASDVDPDAVASAREGLYPKPSRPTYRQNDWLASFPKRITATGCRQSCARQWSSPCRMCWPIRRSRVSILCPAAISSSICSPRRRQRSSRLFHFALREGGVLLLGSSETIGNAEDRFTMISKAAAALSAYRSEPDGRFRIFEERRWLCPNSLAIASGSGAVAPGRIG